MRFSMIGLMAAAVLMLGVGDAQAEKGRGKGHGHGRDHAEDSPAHRSDDHSDDDKVTIRIGGSEREIIAGYLRDDRRRHCPPGLAKKNKDCLPPGIAKKYAIGSVLPPDVVALPLPDGLLDLLGPTPRGYEYVQVDKDVLLIGEASKKVIDAVTLLSAVGE